RLAGTGEADAAAALALEMRPSAHEARREMLQLRELDLQFAFVRARALGEDVEDQSRAIEHAALQELLEIALLARRQLVIEDRELGPGRRREIGDLLRLAAADEETRIGDLTAAADDAGDLRAGRQRELPEFLGLGLVIGAGKLEMDQQRALPGLGTLEHSGTALRAAQNGRPVVGSRLRRRAAVLLDRRPRHRAGARRAWEQSSRSRACRPSG